MASHVWCTALNSHFSVKNGSQNMTNHRWIGLGASLMALGAHQAFAATGVAATSNATISNLSYRVETVGSGATAPATVTLNTGVGAPRPGELSVSEVNVKGPLNDVRTQVVDGPILITSKSSVALPDGAATATVNGPALATTSVQVSADNLNREFNNVVNGSSLGYEVRANVGNHTYSNDLLSWTIAPGTRLVVQGQYAISSSLDVSQLDLAAVDVIRSRPSTLFNFQSQASFYAGMTLTPGEEYIPGVSVDQGVSNVTASMYQGHGYGVYDGGPVYEVKPFTLTVTNKSDQSISGMFSYQIGSLVLATATVSVPEPSTYALMGLGLLAVAAVARKGRLNKPH
jgi:hypothetical protein